MVAVLLCMLLLEGDKVLAKQTSTFCFVFGRGLMFVFGRGPPPVVSFFPQRSCNRLPGAHKDRKRVRQALDGGGSHCKIGKSFKSICFWKFVHLVSGMRLAHDFSFFPIQINRTLFS